MMPVYFSSSMWNHLWQSTLFAGLAALVAWALRGNRASTRYRVWMAASLKFLVPFALLSALGEQIGRLTGGIFASVAQTRAVTLAIEQMGRPFPSAPLADVAVPLGGAGNAVLWPEILLAIWACGFVGMAVSRAIRWRRISRAVRDASPLAIKSGFPVRTSAALFEPGVFGFLDPVLVLPEGIAERLPEAQLEAIIAHELCHIRRRDNLAAAIHMAVEAIFWFHPLVWWIGARLVEERELACDEEVLRLGNEAETYAESILRTCQYYLESRVACVSGIAGGDLKKRIVRIMGRRAVRDLGLGRKALLSAAGIAALAGPVAFGMLQSPRMPHIVFDTASIQPNHSGTGFLRINAQPGGYTAINATPKFLIQFAYRVNEAQIRNAPGWAEAERFDVDARQGGADAEQLKNLGPEGQSAQLEAMLQGLLAKRFKLALHHEYRPQPVYVLAVSPQGAKLTGTAPGTNLARRNFRMMSEGELNVTGQSMDAFAQLLSHETGRVVVNRTGLTGEYDFALKWSPDGAGGPSLFDSLPGQLGLKLEPRMAPVDTLVIDRLERPEGN